MIRLVCVLLVLILMLTCSCSNTEELQQLRADVLELQSAIDEDAANKKALAEDIRAFATEGLELEKAMADIGASTRGIRDKLYFSIDDLTQGDFNTLGEQLTDIQERLEELYAPGDAAEVRLTLLQENYFTADVIGSYMVAWYTAKDDWSNIDRWQPNVTEGDGIYKEQIRPLQNRARLLALSMQAERDLDITTG